MLKQIFLLFLTLVFCQPALAAKPETAKPAKTGAGTYAGTPSCRKCHEKFYQLWAPSHHGLAMQPFSQEFAQKELTPQSEALSIGDTSYKAEFSGKDGYVLEKGPQGERKYPITQVLGGKNVYYFLTPLEKGRLQTLPLAYDVREKKWYDTAQSALRHFPGLTEELISWKDWRYTFNTACHGCHVSQYSLNYDSKTDSYRTTWKEPGINCETCHGPSAEHVKVCEAAPKGKVPKDLKIIRGGRDFSKDQNNATCLSCHAKSPVVTPSFMPGDRFFDHFGLVTLEHPDYYPDGRDLGENYTATSWMLSPCVKSGQLDCLHCHTSSGRYKFADESKANQACAPCHAARVADSASHTRHKPGSAGDKCVSCHMPMTDFARMRRSDHSMLPPAPALTIAFGSPNACNLCHKDKTPQWADETVRQWRERDYQAPVLERAKLIEAGRKRDWSKLNEMLAYIVDPKRDEVFAASLVRLVQTSFDHRVLPALRQAASDPSPLVRAAAVETFQGVRDEESMKVLIKALSDDYRLVRLRAAASLAGQENLNLPAQEQKALERATAEYLQSLNARPDQWESNYNLGNYYLDRKEYAKAGASYDKALAIEPRAVLPLVNLAMAQARNGDNKAALETLRKAVESAPQSAAAHFNLGLLLAEAKDLEGAKTHLRAALDCDPGLAQAAYNLSLLLSRENPGESLKLIRQACEARPDDPRYAYTLAFFLQKSGDAAGAVEQLRKLISSHPAYFDAYALLGALYENKGQTAEAVKIYEQALTVDGAPEEVKNWMRARISGLAGKPGSAESDGK